MSSTTPTVVIVDDAADVRSLVKAHLRLSGRLDVVGEGATGADAVALAAEHHPDLMLLDVSMPKMDGLEALPKVLLASPGTRVVMFTGFEERGLVERALELGAVGLLEKSVSTLTLADDLVRVLDDGGVGNEPEPGRAEDDVPVDAPGLGRLPEDILAAHRERFREVFEEATIGMGTMTTAGRLVRANKTMSELVGRPVSELVGRAYVDLMAGSGPDDFHKLISDITDNGADVVQLEHELPVNSTTRRVLMTVAPVRDAERRPLYLFVQVQDVTFQRFAEEALRQSEERFRLLVEAVNDYAIFMLDPNGIVVSWNAGAQRLKGYRADEIIGKHFRNFYPPEKQESRHPEFELQTALKEGRFEEEGWRIRKDGSRFWANVVISAIRGENGENIGFAKVTRDVTERRQMLDEQLQSAQALAMANRELAVANDRLSLAAEDQARFLAVTAHELRGPIGVLRGSAALLKEHWAELDETERSELFDSMSVTTGRLRRMVDDLLTAARLEAGAVQLKPEDVDVTDIAANAIVMARRQARTTDVHLDAPEALHVFGDPAGIAQAVDNLVNNAFQHGLPPVRVAVRRRDDHVDIRVSDSGSGVAPEIEPRLFERFATGARHGGTGLGLFIVRELARSHGGDAWYEQKTDNADATFVVSLPVRGSSLH